MGIPLSLHLGYIAAFGVAFLYSGNLWSSLYYGTSSSGWGSISGLSRFPGWGSLCRCSGGWSWISSLWSAMKCSIMSYEMSVGLE